MSDLRAHSSGGRVVHGHARGSGASSTYSAWNGIRQRCHNPKAPEYHNYGGRGIFVCARWRESYLHFLADMGERPAGMQIDRLNNDGPYSPDNCRWVTPKRNNRNKRTTRYITAFGKTQCLSDWVDQSGIGKDTVLARLRRGMPPELAFTAPLAPRNAPRMRIHGQY